MHALMLIFIYRLHLMNKYIFKPAQLYYCFKAHDKKSRLIYIDYTRNERSEKPSGSKNTKKKHYENTN